MYVGPQSDDAISEDSQLDREILPRRGANWVSIGLIRTVFGNLHQASWPRVEPLILTI